MSKNILLLFFTVLLFSCSRFESKNGSSNINLIINDNETKSASVTGKELLWSRLQIKRKNKLGLIKFTASVNRADLVQIRASNSYSYFNCYIEENQEINVVYENHQYFVTGDNIAARQNQLLIDIDNIRKNTISCATELSSEGVYKDLYTSVDKMITGFENKNKDVSAVFLKYVRFDNKYFYLRQIEQNCITNKGNSLVYSAEKLKLLRSTISDSDYELAYLSPNYRAILKEYLDNVRMNDDYMLKATINPIENERILASEIKNNELREFQMATSLKQLLEIDCQLDLKNDIRNNTGYWQHFLQEEYVQLKNRRTSRIESQNGSYKHLNTSFLTNILDSAGMQKWKYLEIDNLSEDSGIENNYMESISNHIPGLVCISVTTNPLNTHDKLYSRSDLCYVPKSELEKCLKSKELPYSLLINPQGQVIIINLPKPSTGMLEPMLRKLI